MIEPEDEASGTAEVFVQVIDEVGNFGPILLRGSGTGYGPSGVWLCPRIFTSN